MCVERERRGGKGLRDWLQLSSVEKENGKKIGRSRAEQSGAEEEERQNWLFALLRRRTVSQRQDQDREV